MKQSSLAMRIATPATLRLDALVLRQQVPSLEQLVGVALASVGVGIQREIR